ncbi:MAG: hypothetical protein V9G19_11005 [Tetrasphaera sp.]
MATVMPNRLKSERASPVIDQVTELLQDAHIADQPAHQAADAHVVVVIERERVQMAKERAAHVG